MAEAQRSSSWSRMPSEDGAVSAPEEGHSGSDRLREAVRDGAHDVARQVGASLRHAGDALRAPASTEIEALYGGAELPDLCGDDPLAALALRLDREGDFWRSLALRALARAAWADRVAQGIAILAALGCAALATIGAVGLLFGGSGSPGRTAMLLACASALVGGGAFVAWVSSMIRRSQREIARDANGRAALSELRLHRVGVVLATRRLDPSAEREALARLEKDVAS